MSKKVTALDRAMMDAITSALAKHLTISRAATSLAVTRKTLASWMRDYGIKRRARK